MKKLLSVIVLLLFLSLAPHTFAETSVDISNNGEGASSEVHVESSTGENTVCVNGQCTTTQNGGSSATVCINGKCETSQDGNIEKNEGGTRVHVENNSNQSNPPPSHTPIPSPQQDFQKETSKSAEASISAQTDKQNAQQVFFEEILNTIRNFFNELFS